MLCEGLLKKKISKLIYRLILSWAYCSIGLLASSTLMAVTVTNQVELDMAINQGVSPINIVAAALSLSNGQNFDPDTALGIANGASLSITAGNQILGSLSGAGTLFAGTRSLVIGTNNSNAAFSGTLDFIGEAWDAAHGIVSKTGSGALTIDNALIPLGEAFIFQGSMEQTSGATAINSLIVGEGTGNTGVLNVSGGTLTFRTALQVGDFGGQGIVNQTAGTVILPATCGDPAFCSLLRIGNDGGSGTYNINGGTLILNGGLIVLGHSTGFNPASTGTLNIGGGLVELSGDLNSSGQFILGSNNNSHGGINQSGGILRIANDSTLYLAGTNGAGIYNLNNGILEIGGSSLQAQNLDYQFNLGGGTITVTGTSLVSTVNATLMPGTISTINTNGLNAQWDGVLSGGGGLAKDGNGTFTQNVQGTYSGATLIHTGVFAAGAANVLAADSAFTLANAGILNLNNFDNAIGSLSGSGHVILGAANLTNGNDGTSTTFSGFIDGSGRLTKNGAGTLTLSGDNSSFMGTTELNNGSLVINNALGGDLNTSAATMLRGNGIVAGYTTINGLIQPGSSSVGTLTFNGDYVQGSGSTYNMEILNSTRHNIILVAGSATINNSTQVNLLNQDILPANTTMSILHADGGVNGQYSALLAKNRPFLDLSLNYGANDVFLFILRNSLALMSYAVTPNQMAVANAIDNISNVNPQDPLYLAVVNLQDPLLMPTVFNSLSGQIHVAALGSYIEESRYLRDAVFNRLNDLQDNSSLSNTIAHCWSNSGLWLEGYGAWGNMNTPSSNTASLSRSNRGLFIGFDTSVTEHWQTGVVAGFGETHLNMPALDSNGNSNNRYIGLYTRVQAAKVTGDFGAAYAGHHLNTQRFVGFPGVENVLHANYQVPSKQIFAEVGYDLYSRVNYNFKPFVQAAYVDVSRASLRESGGISALTGYKATDDMPYSTTGIRMNLNLGQLGEFSWKSRALLGWQHAYRSINPLSLFAFTSSSAFLISGVPVAQNAALIDVAVDVGACNDNLHVILGYLSQLSAKIQDNGLQGTLSYRFM